MRNIRGLRRNRGWSVRELADRLAAVGCETATEHVIWNWEIKRRKVVSVDELLALARVFRVNPARLYSTEPR